MVDAIAERKGFWTVFVNRSAQHAACNLRASMPAIVQDTILSPPGKPGLYFWSYARVVLRRFFAFIFAALDHGAISFLSTQGIRRIGCG